MAYSKVDTLEEGAARSECDNDAWCTWLCLAGCTSVAIVVIQLLYELQRLPPDWLQHLAPLV